MLREISSARRTRAGGNNTQLVGCRAREILRDSCLCGADIGIGRVPRIVTDTYRASIEAACYCGNRWIGRGAVLLRRRLIRNAHPGRVDGPRLSKAPALG